MIRVELWERQSVPRDLHASNNRMHVHGRDGSDAGIGESCDDEKPRDFEGVRTAINLDTRAVGGVQADTGQSCISRARTMKATVLRFLG